MHREERYLVFVVEENTQVGVKVPFTVRDGRDAVFHTGLSDPDEHLPDVNCVGMHYEDLFLENGFHAHRSGAYHTEPPPGVLSGDLEEVLSALYHNGSPEEDVY